MTRIRAALGRLFGARPPLAYIVRFVVYWPPMVVRMRATKSHRNNRRSHHALVAPAIATCECGATALRHQACAQCGKYRGRQVIDVVARVERTQARLKRKAATMRDAGEAEKTEKKAAEAAEKKS